MLNELSRPGPQEGSLHPDILSRIGVALQQHPYMGWQVYQHPPLPMVRDKIEHLQQKTENLIEAIVSGSPGYSLNDALHVTPFFYVAKTMAFETKDFTHNGLATVFVHDDKPIHNNDKERILLSLGYKKALSPKDRAVLARAGTPEHLIVSGRMLDSMRFGGNTSINLRELGATPGTVGPWKLTADATPIRVLRPSIDEREYKESELHIVDFALTQGSSLLVLGFQHSYELIREVARSGNYERSLEFV